MLLKHLLVISQQELKPVSLSVSLDLNVKSVVNCLVLLFDKGNEVLGLVVELEFIYEGLKELPYLSDKDKYDTDNHKVEECQLDDQEETIYKQEEHNELDKAQWHKHIEWHLPLTWLEVWLGLQFFDRFLVAFVKFLSTLVQLHPDFIVLVKFILNLVLV